MRLSVWVAVGTLAVGTAAFAVPKKYSPYAKLNLFTRVLSYVENNYVESVDQDELFYGAVRGLTESLDPHSSYLKPELYREMKIDTEGKFGGVGIEVEMREAKDGSRERILTIMNVFEGTPAQRGGLVPGDQILRVDDQLARTMRMEDALLKMRGKKGSTIKLTVVRPGDATAKEPRTVVLTREMIKIENLSSRMLESGIGYARIKQFNENTDRELGQALDRLDKEAPGGKLAGLVLDLRNNPGGLFDQAVRVADQFLDSGLIVRTEGRGGRVLDEEKARPAGTRAPYPMVVLVNGGSASASEIVAGALQDHGRAVILGTTTFGKGSVQTLVEFEDGSALKLTIARYFTPSGRSIQERGISPDLEVEQLKLVDGRPRALEEPQHRERDLDGHLKNLNPGEASSRAATSTLIGDDFQLKTAYEHLRAWKRMLDRHQVAK